MAPADVVRELYRRFGGGDVDGALALYGADATLEIVGERTDVPYFGRWSGHAGLREFYALVAETTDVQEYVPEQWIETASGVIVIGHEAVTVKASGKSYRSPWIAVFRFEGDRIASVREFFDTATMARAFRAD